MKYIKKFNEELNANTYMKVAKSLKDLKHNKRADKLEKHARIISQLNKLNELVKDLKKYEPYGIFDAGCEQGSKLKEQFALKMWYDDWSLKESFEDYEKEYNSYFWVRLSIGLLPILEEGEEEHIRTYYSNISARLFGDDYIDKLSEMEEANAIGRVCDYFAEKNFWGSFSGPSIYVKMIIDNGKIVIKGIDVDDDGGENVLNILGRKSGMQFKNLLVKLFSNEKFDYPTYNDQNLQQTIKYEICEKSGFSAKYQFAFGEIGEFIKKDSVNKYYNTFNFVN